MPDHHIKTDDEGNTLVCKCDECEYERRLEAEMRWLDEVEL